MAKFLLGLGKALLFSLIALCLAVTIVPSFLDHIYYRGPKSANFDGQRFFNPDGEDTFRIPQRGSPIGFIGRWLSGKSDRAPWPEHVAVNPSKPKSLPPLKAGEMRATWVGHATVLIETPGLNILTDPIWSDVAGKFGIGPHRVTVPGIAFDDLPKIDIVVVSHNHYDHMDLPTLKRLWQRDRPQIFTSLGNDVPLRQIGVPSRAFDWGQGLSHASLCTSNTLPEKCAEWSVTVTRNHHWGSRWGADRSRALWSSFFIKTGAGNIFFAGDTGFGDGKWPGEARALGPIRLAILPIGAFRFGPGMMEIGSHMGPIQSAEVFARLGATRAIAIHWGTFHLSNEAYDTPPKMLAEVMKCRGWPEKGLFDAVKFGDPVMIPAYAAPPAGHAPDASCLNAPAITALP